MVGHLKIGANEMNCGGFLNVRSICIVLPMNKCNALCQPMGYFQAQLDARYPTYSYIEPTQRDIRLF